MGRDEITVSVNPLRRVARALRRQPERPAPDPGPDLFAMAQDDSPPHMPPEALAELIRAYEGAEVILEYGSGGSTKLAAQLPGKTVFSVESDKTWMQGLQAWLDRETRQSTVHLHHGDIGPTREWGVPADPGTFRKWSGYPNSVWERPDFQHPDVVLIDGRFRLACMVTVLVRATKPVVMLVDDYADRPAYHRFEELVRPTRCFNRMARFDLAPMTLPGTALSWVVGAHLQPQ